MSQFLDACAGGGIPSDPEPCADAASHWTLVHSISGPNLVVASCDGHVVNTRYWYLNHEVMSREEVVVLAVMRA